jgi:hypothetical protein
MGNSDYLTALRLSESIDLTVLVFYRSACSFPEDLQTSCYYLTFARDSALSSQQALNMQRD